VCAAEREKQLEDRVHSLVKALGEKEAKVAELTKSTDDLHSERRTMLNSINDKNSRIKLLEGSCAVCRAPCTLHAGRKRAHMRL
jgi:uncharacterized protein YlxW (UPF0749 family)